MAKYALEVSNLNNICLGEQDLLLKWIQYLDTSPNTAKTYYRAIRQFYNYLRDNSITEPTRNDVIAFRDSLKQRCKSTTIQNYLTALKLFFRWTELENIYPNIATRVKGLKIERNYKKDYLTSKQVKELLASIDRSSSTGKRDYALILLMVTTGLRTISIARANIEDIRPAGECLALYFQGKGRTGKTEYVKLAEPVEKAIKDYLKTKPATTEALFSSTSNKNNGGRLTTRSISRIVKNRLVEAGYNSSRLTAHSLRHTTATLNLLNGASIIETQQLLGHSNINTTMLYTHALERANNNSELRIANSILD